jgi:hypothetical protein
LVELIELVSMCVAALVTTIYAAHEERLHNGSAFSQNASDSGSTHGDSLGFFHAPFVLPLVAEPSQSAVLVAGIVMGLAVSSFLFRRQQRRNQGLAFLAVPIAVGATGLVLGASSHLVMLVLVPWTVCACMLVALAATCIDSCFGDCCTCDADGYDDGQVGCSDKAKIGVGRRDEENSKV